MKNLLFLAGLLVMLFVCGCPGGKDAQEIPEDILQKIVEQTTTTQPPAPNEPASSPPASSPPQTEQHGVPATESSPEGAPEEELTESELADKGTDSDSATTPKKPCPDHNKLFIGDDPKGQGDGGDAGDKLGVSDDGKVASLINSFVVFLAFIDLSGKPADEIHTGGNVLITPTFHNNTTTRMEYTVIVEVRDASGITVYLQWASGQLEGGGEESVGLSWVPTSPGTYEARSFVITNLTNPQVLSPITSETVDVN